MRYCCWTGRSEAWNWEGKQAPPLQTAVQHVIRASSLFGKLWPLPQSQTEAQTGSRALLISLEQPLACVFVFPGPLILGRAVLLHEVSSEAL